MAGFKLAEAHVELKAKGGHEVEGTLDRLTKKTKEYGAESQKVQQLSTKMLFAIGAGASGMETIILKVGGAIRSLGSKLLEAGQQGKSFGDAIARWGTEVTGVENAVTRLDKRLREMNAGPTSGMFDRLLGLGGPSAIPGIDPGRSAMLQKEKGQVELGLVSAQDAQKRAREALAAAESGPGVMQQMAGVTSAGAAAGVAARAIFGDGKPNAADAQQAVDEAALAVQEMQLKLKQVNDLIASEVKQRNQALQGLEKATAQEQQHKEQQTQRQSALDRMQDQLKQQAQARGQRFDDLSKRAAGVFDMTRTDEERQRAERDAGMKELAELQRGGFIDSNTYTRRLRQLNPDLFGQGGAGMAGELDKATRQQSRMMGAEEMARFAQGGAGVEKKIQQDQLTELKGIRTAVEKPRNSGPARMSR